MLGFAAISAVAFGRKGDRAPFLCDLSASHNSVYVRRLFFDGNGCNYVSDEFGYPAHRENVFAGYIVDGPLKGKPNEELVKRRLVVE